MGGSIVMLLCPLIGRVGTYVVIVILMIICGILVTEKSLLSPLSHKSKAAYEDAKKRKQVLAQRRADRQVEKENKKADVKARRLDKKVSGVSFATTLSDKTIHRKTPDLQELTPEDTGAGEAPVPSPFEELVINVRSRNPWRRSYRTHRLRHPNRPKSVRHRRVPRWWLPRQYM